MVAIRVPLIGVRLRGAVVVAIQDAVPVAIASWAGAPGNSDRVISQPAHHVRPWQAGQQDGSGKHDGQAKRASH